MIKIKKKGNIHFGPCMGVNDDGDQLEQYSHDGTVLVAVAVPVVDSGALLVHRLGPLYMHYSVFVVCWGEKNHESNKNKYIS